MATAYQTIRRLATISQTVTTSCRGGGGGPSEGVRGTYCEDNVGTAASMYYLEDQWAIGGLDVAGQWDVNLEEIWHVVSKGWYAVYPDEFGDEWEQEGFTSKLMEAMDVARGGSF